MTVKANSSEKIIQTSSMIFKASVSLKERTLAGTATRYGETASAHGGRVHFLPGSLSCSADLKRVKLLLDHNPSQPIGYTLTAQDVGNELRMSFYVPETPLGDEALLSAEAGLRDGFSVGVYIPADGYTYDDEDDAFIVSKGIIREVSLLAIPAFDDARVAEIHAQQERPHMDEDEVLTPPTPPEPATQASADPTPPTPPAPAVQAAAPQMPPVQAKPRLDSIRAAAEFVIDMVKSGSSGHAIQAALQDVLIADIKDPAAFQTTYLGKLWSARRTDRLWIDSVDQKPLSPTGLKQIGWGWKVRPAVGSYEGNKAEIPSNKPETTPTEVSVERMAGGWDLDRIFFDRGDPAFLEEYWAAALEDYLVKTDAKVAETLLEAATVVPESPNGVAALTTIGRRASAIGAKISAVGFGADAWEALAGMPKEQVPWWMGAGDSMSIGTSTGVVGNLRLFNDPALAGSQIVALDSRALTYREETPPIRIQAVDLAHGGIDLGVFGYYTRLVNDARAIFKLTIATPDAP